MSDEEKTEEATPKKREEARTKGNVCKSQEVNSVFVLTGGVVALQVFGGWIFDKIVSFVRSTFKIVAQKNIGTDTVVELFSSSVILALQVSAPILVTIAICGVLANLLQIGWLVSTKALEPKLDKLDVIKGSKKLVALRSWVEGLKSIIKVSIIGIVGYLTLSSRYDEMILLSHTTSAFAIWEFLLDVAVDICMNTIYVLILLALLDWLYQKFEYEKQLKMSKQEIKDENKNTEGNPEVKGRIRSLQREMAQRRMMDEVPEATVVVTNPTHLSIAIKYIIGEMETPLVVAKGKDNLALKIREIAKEHDVPLVEDKPLARAMYNKVEPGDEIPVEFFNAVAEVLAYVYKLKDKKSA